MIMRAQRGRGLGQDDPFTNALNVAQTPVTLQVSPLLLGGVGLMALALVLRTGQKAGSAVVRKTRAVRRALKA